MPRSLPVLGDFAMADFATADFRAPGFSGADFTWRSLFANRAKSALSSIGPWESGCLIINGDQASSHSHGAGLQAALII